MDGAMGSELLRAGARAGECLEAWNLTRPDAVKAIHQSYIDAGARVLLTNTFQANIASLSRHGLQDRQEEIVRAGVGLARECAGQDGFVFGDIGPTDPEAVANVASVFDEADGVLLETWSDASAVLAARRCRERLSPQRPLLLSMTYRRDDDGRPCTLSGHGPEFFAEQAEAAGVAALGVNCGRDIGIETIIEILRRYRTATSMPLFARPNAGTPTRTGAGWEYPCTPGQFADGVADIVKAGAVMIGGCCGAGPKHIAALRTALASCN